MTPFFSIIVPVYNAEPFLRDSLDSIQAQTFANWEVVCINDGSTDGSGSVLDDYAARDGRFHVIRQENKGVGEARNCGLAEAKGDWIWFVDADDAVHPEALDYVFRVLEACPGADAFSCPRLLAGEKPAKVWEPLHPSSFQIFETKGARELPRFVNSVCSLIFRRTCLADVRFTHHAFGEDTLFFSALFWNTRLFVFDSASLYFRRVHPDSATGRPTYAMAQGYIRMMTDLVALLRPHIVAWSQEERIAWTYRKTFLACHKDCFILISDADRKALLGQWLALQRTTLDLKISWRYTGFAVALLRVCPSGWLAKHVIAGVLRAQDRTPLKLLQDVFIVVGRKLTGQTNRQTKGSNG